MGRKIKLLLEDFPGLEKLIKGQKATLKFRGIIYNKQDGTITFDTDGVDMEDVQTMSPSEIMLASAVKSLSMQNFPTG